ncbi:MAG: glutamine amidotransferase family protein [Sphaerochaetaceae bacterium]|jgi:glutamate synthase domain-containing protein 1|nr:glutamine amidotransferase family protein [Sphaerochaetaceae bacterium]MDC7238638.1 glutamine amidotransferase family protein [Sphaerochaetaceae bacterium]MDC7250187.1 glutamine amidotransferase family protein [Sphaerochaetaceae bacterium]
MDRIKKEGEIRIPSGCAISGIISKKGNRFSGQTAIDSIRLMHDRSNGLGGGFAGYGIYPEYKDYYAFHIFYMDTIAKNECMSFLEEHFDLINLSKIPTRKIPSITDEPMIWRYFLSPLPTKLAESQLTEEEYVVRCTINVNAHIKGAFIVSSGKNMGVFKAQGYPEDVGEFYKLEEYSGYSWTAHGRYPTNTPGWWGGAHPFSLLNYSVVHNGEISSYDANRRYIEMFGYKCNLQTDTEVITYMIDFLNRKKNIDLKTVAHILAAPFWSTIERMDETKKLEYKYLRNNYESFLVTGPFSIIVSYQNGLMALNDRLKLRSLVVGEKDDMVYMASEEEAIRVIAPELDSIYYPKGGEPYIVELETEVQ